ncbi:MAG: hypothetical protein JWP44_4936 [Mucilaginibacter sp.]|nr:hypothetical protein [Mucilaginibacter sp.]
MQKIGHLEHDKKAGKWKAWSDGLMLCQSQNKQRLIDLVRQGLCPKAAALGVVDLSEDSADVIVSTMISGGAKAGYNTPIVAKPLFTANQRFEFFATFTDDVIYDNAKALLVTGSPGMGKSHTVMERLAAAKLCDSPIEKHEGAEDGKVDESATEVVEDHSDFTIIKGFSTARAMYDNLYTFRNKLIIYDDTDKVLEDKIAGNILKAALDNDDKRVITWGSAGIFRNKDIPTKFEFKGRMIFISNKPLSSFDSALKSRCLCAPIEMTPQERITRIEYVLPNIMKDVSMEMRRNALDFLKENMDACPAMDFRTFKKIVNFRRLHTNWKQLALFSLSAS